MNRNKIYMNRNNMRRMPFVMRGNWSKEWMESFAKTMGVKFIWLEPTLISKEKIEISPLSPPSGKLYYFTVKYE